jgi:CelD/BcsL family acetyltransferase involved in cellulose biosynthesis
VLSTLRDRIGELVGASPERQMEHDLVWLEGLTGIPSQSVAVFLVRRGDRIVGYAPFVVYPTVMALELGGIRLMKRKVTRWVLAGEPILDPELAARSADVVADLLRTVRSQMAPGNVVFLAAVAADSELFGLIGRRSALHRDYHVVAHGPSYQRRGIRMAGSYDAYLKSLRASTRRSLKRARKNFLGRAGEDFSVRRFESPGDVEPFLQHAVEVSKKTYQWHLLGQGMRDNEIRTVKYSVAAANGWFRSYILYAGETPIAFASGYLHEQTYFGHELGCDSAWRESNAGIFLATEILQDLFADAAPAEGFDFLYGDSPLKSRLANTSRMERHFCLIPRGFNGAMMAYPLRTINWLSAAASATLRRLRIKDRLWRLRRRRSVKEP